NVLVAQSAGSNSGHCGFADRANPLAPLNVLYQSARSVTSTGEPCMPIDKDHLRVVLVALALIGMVSSVRADCLSPPTLWSGPPPVSWSGAPPVAASTLPFAGCAQQLSSLAEPSAAGGTCPANLIGGPLLSNAQAAALVVRTPKSRVETG